MIQINNTIIQNKSKTKKAHFFTIKNFSFSSLMLSIMILVIMVLILVNPTRYAESVIKGLKLFFTAVLPGLLPFMFLCKILTGLNVFDKLTKPLNKPMQKLFGINGNGFYAFLMSIISGYPLGCKITADLFHQGKISNQELTKTAIISSTSGLEFIIGAVGGLMLGSPLLGVAIYISNVLATLLASIIINIIENLKKRKKPQENITKSLNYQYLQTKNQKQNTLNIITSSAIDTCSSLLVVGFYIAIFSLVIDLLTDLSIIKFLSAPLNLLIGSSEISSGIVSGILEMTNGAKILSSNITPLTISAISMLISFSGISIIMQSFSFLSNVPVKKGLFIIGKILQAILSFFICLIISSFIL